MKSAPSSQHPLILGLTLSVLLLSTSNGSNDKAAEWSRFRGPNGSGVAPTHYQPPITLGPEFEAWRTRVPAGLSSPVIGNGRIFLTGIEGEQLVTLAFEHETGKLLWRRNAPVTASEKVHSACSPAASTPLVYRGHLYVYFGSFGLLCYDLDGTEIWRKPIPTPQSLYGMSTSPIGNEDHVILVLDSDRNLTESKLSESAILAVNASDGETAWKTSRPFSRSGWSTPVLLKHHSRTDLIVLGHGRLQAYDAKTGEGRWFLKGFSRETIAVPLIGTGMIFASSSRLGGGGDIEKNPEPFWNSLMPFDSNSNGQIERSEMVGDFTFPFRPELPPGHPGFGMPLPKDNAKRRERIDWILTWIDKNNDGIWTREEFFENLRTGKESPLLAAVTPGGRGDISTTHVEWEINRGIPEVPSPIFHEGEIYLVRKGGVLSALNAQSGDSLFRERIPDAPGQYAASPVIANDHLYLVSSLGLVSIVRIGESLDLVHQFDLREFSETTPAIDASTIYFRTGDHLIAYRNKKGGNQP